MASPGQSPIPATYEAAHEAWLAERDTFIGGSEVFHLFNLAQYGMGCARFLGYKKQGYPFEVEFSREDEALLKRGHLFEPLAASLYEDATGRNVRRPPYDKFGFSKPRRHPKYPFLGVHTDRMILAGSGEWQLTDEEGRMFTEPITETGDLELKSHGEGMFLRILREGMPPGHHLQIQHSILVNERSRGSLGMVGVFGGLPMEYVDVAAIPKVREGIISAGSAFWDKMERRELPERLPDAEDLRCQVCAFRMECRGQEVDAASVRFVKDQAKSDKVLVPITDADLVRDLCDLQLIKDEVRTLDHDSDTEPGAVQLLETKILGKFKEMGLDKNHKPYIPGVLSCALVPTQFNGLDQQRLKDKHREVYDDCYVSHKFTGNTSLRLYKIEGKKKAKRPRS